MTFWQRRQQAERLRSIPLETVLPLCGGRPDRDDKHKWHTPEGALSLNGPKFMNWNRGLGGGGAIDLVIHLKHLDFKAAIDWLAQHFPLHANANAAHSFGRSQQTGACQTVFGPPAPNPSWGARSARPFRHRL
jgi:hypothetical protein